MEENELIEEDGPTVGSIAKKWGVINGLIGVAFFIIVDITGQAGNQALQWVGLAIFLVILILAHKEFKSEGNGYMSYGQGLGIGTLTAVFSGLISNIFFFIYVSFINSGFIEVIKQRQIEGMQEQGMSDAEIERAMGFSEFMMNPVAMAIMGFIMGLFFAFLLSLIVSIFTKNQEPEFS